MSPELVSILGLVGVFLVATMLPVHMGVLAFVAAFAIGHYALGVSVDQIASGFPSGLFIVLAGVTYLFAIADGNGTVGWLVQCATRLIAGRVVLIPWVMFLMTALLTAMGALVPAAVAIVAPIGMGLAKQYRIKPVLMGLMIVNGSNAGGFSPIGVYSAIVGGVVSRSGLVNSPVELFISCLAFNAVLSVVTFYLLGGRELINRSVWKPVPFAVAAGARTAHTMPHPEGEMALRATGTAQRGASVGAGPGAGQEELCPPDAPHGKDLGLNRERLFTLGALVGLAVGSLLFGLNVGFTALTAAVLLSLVSPSSAKSAVDRIAWPTILLVCGIVTYVDLMQHIGAVSWLSQSVATIGSPVISALMICLIGAIVSMFASTTGILGALIPLAVPIILSGHINSGGLILALCISASVVCCCPFSTSGALVVANASGAMRDLTFKRLLLCGFSFVVLMPIVSWLIFIVLPHQL
jgi:di/tricarboxylate transporter